MSEERPPQGDTRVRIRDTPGGDPRILKRAGAIAKQTYSSAYQVGATIAVLTATAACIGMIRSPAFRKKYSSNTIIGGVLGFTATGLLIASSISFRNATEEDRRSSRLNESAAITAQRTQYMNDQVRTHNDVVESFDARFENRRRALARHRVRPSGESDDPAQATRDNG